MGLSSLCFRDHEYWLTRSPLVYDVHVEDYAVHRVMRQFGLYQAWPVEVTQSVPAQVHRYGPSTLFMFFHIDRKRFPNYLFNVLHRQTRQGGGPGSWTQKMQPYLDRWASALDDRVQEYRPHTWHEFVQYLRWYMPRTRLRVMHVPRQLPTETAPVTQTYPQGRDYTYDLAVRTLIHHYFNYLFMLPPVSNVDLCFLCSMMPSTRLTGPPSMHYRAGRTCARSSRRVF